jgi:hypothetical protein
MKLRTLLAVACATAGLSCATAAAAGTYTSYTSVLSGGTLIDFEGLSGGTLVDTQYAGVTFGQTPGGRPQIDEFPWIFGYGASSGDQVLTGSTEGGNTFDTIAGITVAFSSGHNAVEFFFSDTAQLGDYPIVFYGLGGSVLGGLTLPNDGSVLPPGYAGGIFPPPGTFPLPGLFVGFTSAGDDIYGIGIGPGRATNDSFGIDDLRFSSNSVPEPATWGLMILGFGAAGSALRRRRTLSV